LNATIGINRASRAPASEKRNTYAGSKKSLATIIQGKKPFSTGYHLTPFPKEREKYQ
jgi:hypothetical protein